MGNQLYKIPPSFKMAQVGWGIHKLKFGELEYLEFINKSSFITSKLQRFALKTHLTKQTKINMGAPAAFLWWWAHGISNRLANGSELQQQQGQK
jgi:hypothetical protein